MKNIETPESNPILVLLLLIAIGITIAVAFLARKRKKVEYHMFSKGNPLEALIWALLLGIGIFVIALIAYYKFMTTINDFGIQNLLTLLTTLVVAPMGFLLLYWKAIDSSHDKIATGIQMLSSDNIVQRISSLYYIEHIAKESSYIFPSVIEILCGYVRTLDKCKELRKDEPLELRAYEFRYGINMISRLWHYNAYRRRNLWNFNANLRPDLSLIDFSIQEHFDGVNLDKFFLNNSDFTKCDLSKANLNCASLVGVKFIKTTLVEAYLCNANFKNADLTDADMRGAYVYGADFTLCDLITFEQLQNCIGNSTTLLPKKFNKYPENWDCKPALFLCLKQKINNLYAKHIIEQKRFERIRRMLFIFHYKYKKMCSKLCCRRKKQCVKYNCLRRRQCCSAPHPYNGG